MAPKTKKSVPKPRQQKIDAYHSTSTGHQVSNGVSKATSWHKSRSAKLQQQFKANPAPLLSVVSAKAPTQTLVIVSARAPTSPTSETLAVVSVKAPPSSPTLAVVSAKPPTTTTTSSSQALAEDRDCPAPAPPLLPPPSKKLFANCSIYINGTTAPVISDVELKRLLSIYGARISMTLLRKSTTHVIISKVTTKVAGGGGGAGGGLAAGKLQKEIAGKANNIKYVSVKWVLDSIHAGKRLSETKYGVLNLCGEKQKSVAAMFAKK